MYWGSVHAVEYLCKTIAPNFYKKIFCELTPKILVSRLVALYKFDDELHLVSIKNKVCHTIGVDLIGPLLENVRKTLFPVYIPSGRRQWHFEDKKARGVAEFLFQCFTSCCNHFNTPCEFHALLSYNLLQ